MIATSVYADTLSEQRQRYQQTQQALSNNQMADVARLMPELKTYPLYPYLEYRLLSNNLEQESIDSVSRFIQQYADFPAVKSLKSNFISELAKRSDWRGLLAFSPEEPLATGARCHWYYAKWSTGEQQMALQEAKKLWLTGSSLPSSCDRLFSAWQDTGGMNAEMLLQRILLAAEAGNSGLVKYLAKRLPENYQTIAKEIIELQDDPRTITQFARSTGQTDFARKMILAAFPGLARLDAEAAKSAINELVRLQNMSEKEQQSLKEPVAWQLMGDDLTTEQALWRDNVIMRSESVTLLERRIRLALANNDRRGMNTWLARLPVEAKEKDEWRYWQADLLAEQDRQEEADEILHQLTRERGFYSMAAAQKLGINYPLNVVKSAQPDSSIDTQSEIARIKELKYWQMDSLALSEWVSLVKGKTASQQSALARYAFERNWWDLSVQATIVGKMWDNLEERFPLAWPELFSRFTQDKAITQSYAMAIARQESGLNPKARSPVGASGLMQVMPATASHTATRYAISDYVNGSQLLEPRMSIQIGTRYLESVYQRFEQNRIFASAAYNAGPSRVKRWLNNSAGQLDAVAFIETIPFSETRGYVKNVLAYDAYYRHFMQQKGALFTESEWQRRY